MPVAIAATPVCPIWSTSSRNTAPAQPMRLCCLSAISRKRAGSSSTYIDHAEASPLSLRAQRSNPEVANRDWIASSRGFLAVTVAKCRF